MKNKHCTMRIFLLVLFVFTCFSSHLLAAEHKVFTELLNKHVHKGFIRYSALKQDPRLKQYIAQLTATDPAKIKGSQAKLAFWINAYNAFTLKLITDNYPLASISKLHRGGSLALSKVLGGTVWETWKFKINNKDYSLDQIEHKIIRVKFKEPRVHAALVCAAKSCPPLRAEAYEGAKLNKQLGNQMRQWLSDSTRNRFDAKNKTLYLSKIFSWFQSDFADSPANLIKYTLAYWPASVRKQLKKYKKLKDIKISYLKYDWSLNDAK